MKRKYLVLSIVLILSVGIGVYFIRTRRLADSFSDAAYVGYCSRCKCAWSVQPYQVSIIRQGGSPRCLLCPKCQEEENKKRRLSDEKNDRTKSY